MSQQPSSPSQRAVAAVTPTALDAAPPDRRLPAAGQADPQASIRFAMTLGRALHRYGTPAHRLEEVMTVVSAQLGIEARFVATPTAIFASFGPPEAQQATLIRGEPGSTDLRRLARIDEVANDVVEGRTSPSDGASLVEAQLIDSPSSALHRLARVVCFALSSAAGAQLYGGGLAEVAVSGGVGLLLGLLDAVAAKVPAVERGFEPIAAFIASAVSVSLTRLVGHFSTEVATLAALVYLLPGLALTQAMMELSTRNLIAGTSRFSGAMMVFMLLGFGVALGRRIDVVLPAAPPAVPITPLPGWSIIPGLLVLTVALAVLFKARRHDFHWILLAAVVAAGGARVGAAWLGPELGAFLGALALGIVSNGIARIRRRPTIITVVPGIMVLVPGSVGYRSIESMLAQDVVNGLATAFSMVFVLVGLASGLVLANAFVTPRRIQL
ncbi:MAG: threonine/serine exporter family protein [Myxococcales bacterium]